MLIIEGIDGVGKTTLVEYFQNNGMRKFHFDYDTKNMDLVSKYMKIIEMNEKNLVLDRSFVSEMVYGPIIRNNCKLQIDDYKRLLIVYHNADTKIIYLTAPKEILLSRRSNDKSDYEIITNYYDELNSRYDEIMNYSLNYIDVITINTYEKSIEQVRNKVKSLVKK